MKRYCFILVLVLLILSVLLTSCGDSLPKQKKPVYDDDYVSNATGGETEDNTEDETPDIAVTVETTVRINEVCTKNTNAESANLDWIELYNAGTEPVNLGGWRLSDSNTQPARYVFPAGTILAGGAYLIVWASGGEAPPATLRDASYYTSFRLSNDGETLYFSNPNGEMAGIMKIPALPADTAWGCADASGEIFATLECSPAQSNNGKILELADSVMTFSHESGFYADDFELNIAVPDGYTVRYTIDCTDPKSASALYFTTPISVTDPSGAVGYSATHFSGTNLNSDLSYVDKCFVVRAVARDAAGHYTKTVTKNYFVGFDEKAGYQALPILTLTTDPDEIYGSDTGLFPNYAQEKLEKQVNFMLFNEGGLYNFDMEVGIRIRGSSTRNALQKNLNIYARSEYGGESQFPNSLFPDATFTKSLVLRSDNRWNLQLGQDYLQALVKDRDIATQDSFPLIVFLDGEYYGLYNLYERFSEDFVEAHYGVDDKDVWTVKFGREANVDAAQTAYDEMMSLMTSGTLADTDAYARLCNMVDMQSLIDLFCVHMYYENGDFSMTQNISAWRAAPSAVNADNPYADGKWRFVLFDLDYAMDGPAQLSSTWLRDTFSVQPKNQALGDPFLKWPAVVSLMKSSTFCSDFVTTFLDIAGINFSYDGRVKTVMQEKIDLLYPSIATYLRRYNYKNSKGVIRSASDWSSRLKEKQVAFMEKRYAVIVPKMLEHFSSTGVLASLSVASNTGGIVSLGTSTLSVTDTLTTPTVKYVVGQTLHATATATEGYRFVRWEIVGAVTLSSDETSETASFTLGTSGGTLRAVFEPVT